MWRPWRSSTPHASKGEQRWGRAGHHISSDGADASDTGGGLVAAAAVVQGWAGRIEAEAAGMKRGGGCGWLMQGRGGMSDGPCGGSLLQDSVVPSCCPMLPLRSAWTLSAFRVAASWVGGSRRDQTPQCDMIPHSM